MSANTTITEAAEATSRSRRTIGRMLDAGQLEGAHREGDGGSWRIPVEALLAAGLTLHAPEPPEPAPPTPARPSPVGTPTDDVELRAELAEWQRRAEVAEAVAAERAAALDDLRTALALAQRMLGTSAPADSPTPTPEQRPGSSKSEPMLVTPEQRPGPSKSEPMLVTPEQESADADTLVVAEPDRAIRSVAYLTEATLTGHARRSWHRSPKSGAETSESRSDPVGDRHTSDRWGPASDSPTSQRPTLTSRLRAKLRGF